MPSIDERIVQMRFDNRQFEEGVATSLGTLDKLKQALAFDGSVSGIQKLGNAIGGLTFSPLQNGIEQVTEKFNVLSYAGLKVMTDLANSAVRTGEQLLKNLTIGQVASGWEKYAQKTEAVQTIVSSTGASIDEVSNQLERLNWYTDETSYNFVDMVNNIGKFTNNKIPLKQAVTAMEGIANWAASAGANASQASHAMYNLSQAIGVGEVKLLDWRSIQNAQMATMEFKELAIDAAEALGTLKKVEDGLWRIPNAKKDAKNVEVSVTNFTDAMSNGWFTNDVLLSALSTYGNFTDALNEAYDEIGIDTTSELLDYLDLYRKGELEFKDISKEYGVTVDRLEEIFKRLATDVSFTDALDKAFGLTSSSKIEEWDKGKFLKLVNDYNSGLITIGEASKQTGISVENLSEAFEIMNTSGFAIGEKAFRLGQEAKTFEEAINSVRDAVSTGWMNIFELIFGRYDEAKKLWTALANELWDVFAGPLAELQDVVKMWAQGIYDDAGEELEEEGRRAKLFEAIARGYTRAKEAAGELKDSFTLGIFGEIDRYDIVKKLMYATDAFNEFTKSFTIGEENFEILKDLFFGLGQAIKLYLKPFGLIDDIFKELFKFIKRVAPLFQPLVDLMLEWLHVLLLISDELVNWVREHEFIPRFFETLYQVVEVLVDWFYALIDAVAKWSGINWSFLSEDDAERIAILKDIFHEFVEDFEKYSGLKVPSVEELIDTFKELFKIDFMDQQFLDSDNFELKTRALYDILANFVKRTARLLGIDLHLPQWYQLKDVFSAIKSLFEVDFMDQQFLESGNYELKFRALYDIFSNFVERLAAFAGIDLNLPQWYQLKEIFKSIYEGASPIVLFFEKLKEAVGNFVKGIIVALGGDFNPLNILVTGFKWVVETLQSVVDKAKKIFATIAQVVKPFLSGLKDAIGQFDVNRFVGIFTTIATVLATQHLSEATENIFKFFDESKGLLGVFVRFLKSIKGAEKEAPKLGDYLKNFIHGIGDAINQSADMLVAIRSFAVSVGILVGAVFLLSTIEPERLKASISGVTSLFLDLFGILALYNRFGGKTDTKALLSISTAFIKIGVAIALLSIAMKFMDSVKEETLLNGVIVIGILLAEIFAFTQSLNAWGKLTKDKDPAKALTAVSKTMTKIAIAIAIIFLSFKTLDKLKNPDTIMYGVAAVGALLIEMGVFADYLAMNTNKDGAKIIASATKSLIAISIAITILFKSFATLEQLGNPTDTIIMGLVTIAVLFIELGIFIDAIQENVKGMMGVCLTVIMIAIGIEMMFKAIAGIEALKNIDTLWTGLIAIGVLMLEIVLMSQLLGNSKGVYKAAAAMLIISNAVTKIFKALMLLEDLSIPTIIAGAGAIGLLLVSLAAASRLGKGLNMITLSVSLILLSKALNTLMVPLNRFATMSVPEITNMFLILIGILGAIGIAAEILGPMAHLMLPVIGVVLGLGVALFILSQALQDLSFTLPLLGIAFPLFAGELMLAIGGIIAGIIGFIPGIIAVVVAIITAIVVSIAKNLYKIAQAAFMVVMALCYGIMSATYMVAQTAIYVLVGLAMALINNMDIIALATVVLVTTFINSFATAIRDNTDIILGALGNLLGTCIDFVIDLIGAALDAFNFGWVADALHLDDAKNWIAEHLVPGEEINDRASEAKQQLADQFGTVSQTMKENLGNVASDILDPNEFGAVGTESGNQFNFGLMESLKLGGEGSVGYNIAQGLGDGILDNISVPTTAAEQLGIETMTSLEDSTGVHSPSTKGIEIGQNIDLGVAQGIAQNKGVVTTAIQNTFGGILSDSIVNVSGGSEIGIKMANGVGAGFVLAMRTSSLTMQSTMRTVSESVAMKAAFGMRSKTSALKNAGKVLANEAANGFKSKNSDMYTIGQNAAQGFVNGMRSKITTAAKTAAQVANAAKNAAKNALIEQSPSKAFFEIGAYADQGFINGLLYLKDDVANASESVAEGTLGMMQSTIQRIVDIVTGDYDINPTITPILDMTNVEDGFETMNRYASRQYAVAAGMGGINLNTNAAMMNRLMADMANTGEVSNTSNSNYVITINAPSGNARDIAREVERIIVRR